MQNAPMSVKFLRPQAA
uniref:Uncharacterized protein n=1 Tax=Rhizophora mucronata TaxID=61149 RepID=A0A2P2QWT1_RHIMU